MEPIVNVTDVFPDARLTPVTRLKPGFTVFDTFGGRHMLVEVRVLKDRVRTMRADGQVDYWARDDEIAAVPGLVPWCTYGPHNHRYKDTARECALRALRRRARGG